MPSQWTGQFRQTHNQALALHTFERDIENIRDARRSLPIEMHAFEFRKALPEPVAQLRQPILFPHKSTRDAKPNNLMRRQSTGPQAMLLPSPKAHRLKPWASGASDV